MTTIPATAPLAEAVEAIEDVRLRRFPQYTDTVGTAIDGLGRLPRHWKVKPLKHAVQINPDDLPDSTDDDYWFTYVDIGNVDYVQGIIASERYKFADAPSRARRRVACGDTIISTVRTYLKAVAKIDGPTEDLIVSTGFAVLRPGYEVDPGFLYRCVQSDVFVNRVVAHSTGVSYPAIAPTTLGRFPIWFPPIDEQQAIAQFLDRETVKIDSLVAKKRRLVERLKEKRTALISHAVTKGLNPDAPMKDSGFDWLGDVPEHWEVNRFGMISNVVRGASPRPAGDPRFFFGDFIPWITVGDITKDNGMRLTSTATMLTAEGMRRSRTFPAGTLVLTNSGATLGVPKILDIEGCANDGVVGFEKVSAKAHLPFLYYFLDSLTIVYRDRIKQGCGQPNLNTHIVRTTPIALPGVEEQKAIVIFIERSLEQSANLIRQTSSAIERLHEYRAALISAAITGKIDVRKEAP